jgi:hypothetical protein
VLGGSTDKAFPRHGKGRPRIGDGSCQILFHVSININRTVFVPQSPILTGIAVTLYAISEVEHVGYDEYMEERRKGRRGSSSNELDAGV